MNPMQSPYIPAAAPGFQPGLQQAFMRPVKCPSHNGIISFVIVLAILTNLVWVWYIGMVPEAWVEVLGDWARGPKKET